MSASHSGPSSGVEAEIDRRGVPDALSDQMAADPARLRRVFAAFPTGVTAVAGHINGAPVGLAVSSFTSVSLSPPVVAVCVGGGSRSWPLLRRTGRIGISVLAEDQADLCRRLAGPGDRFFDHDWRVDTGGAVFMAGAAACLECSIRDEVPAGDHWLVLLDVLRTALNPAAAPLVYQGGTLRRLQVQHRDST